MDTPNRHDTAVTGSAQLRRSLSLPVITFYGLGTILGAGIYVLVGKVAGHAGMFAPISFLVASIFAAFSAFSYAELSARFPKSAGEAVYVQEGLGWRPLSMSVGFLIIVIGIVSTATLANGLVGYVQVFMPSPGWLIISVLVLGLGVLSAWGITQSAMAAVLMTVVELAGLLLVIGVGGGNLAALPERWPDLLPSADAGIWVGIMTGAFLAFYAYIGFEDMVNVAEEVKEPSRNLPVAIITVLVVTTVLYFVVSLVAVTSLPPAVLAASDAPLALVYERSTGSSPAIIAFISIFSVTNGALIQVIMASRILYGMSREGWLPPALGRVNPVTQTPLRATLLITGLILVLALLLPLVTLAQITSSFTLSVFALVNFALWRIKGRDPRPVGIRTYPRWISLAGFLSIVAFLLFQLSLVLGS